MKILVLATVFLSLAACSTGRKKIADLEWVSMTRTEVPKASKLESKGPVQGQFCYSAFGSGHNGLMDKAIEDAQEKFKIDFIKNAAFEMDSHPCVYVSGTGYRQTN